MEYLYLRRPFSSSPADVFMSRFRPLQSFSAASWETGELNAAERPYDSPAGLLTEINVVPDIWPSGTPLIIEGIRSTMGPNVPVMIHVPCSVVSDLFAQ